MMNDHDSCSTHPRPTQRWPRPTQRWRWVAAAALGATLLLTTGCGQDQAFSQDVWAISDTVPAAEFDGESAQKLGVTGDADTFKKDVSGEPQPTEPGPTEIRREVVYTAETNIEVDNATATANALRKSVIDGGGYVLQDERYEGSARMVLRMKPSQFDATLAGLAKTGKVRSQSVNASDVTANMVDLEARLKSATISRDRLRALLNGAAKIDDIIKLETELSTREATVEQLQGQLNVIRNQVGFATINVSLTERSVAVVNDTNTTPTEGFQNGWVALRNFGEGLLVFLATVAVWIPLLLIGVFLLRLTGRRWRKKHPKKPTATWTPYVPTNPTASAASVIVGPTETSSDVSTSSQAESTVGS
jgi:Ca-activated chloride channel homolog